MGTPCHLGHMDRLAATMPSQAHAGAAQEAPDIGQWEGQDVPLVRPSSCNAKGGVPSSRRYLPTYAAHEADSDDDYAEQDDYTVEKILAQRPNASAPGGLEFKVRWRGYGPSHDTWEPVSSFVPRINTPFMDYIRKHESKLHVTDLAALTRAIAARGA